MTKFWLTTKSTTAALCLLGIGANTALGLEFLALENDLNDLDECETFDTLAIDVLAIDADTLTCDSSILEEEAWENTEALDSIDPVEFEEFSDPSWQENNAEWETSEPLPTEAIEAEWDNVPDAVTEDWETGEPLPTEAIEAEWDNVPDAATEDWETGEPLPTEAIEAEWDSVPDAVTEDGETDESLPIEETEAEWDNVPDAATEDWETGEPLPTEAIEAEWDNVPDAATEDWESQIEWENVPDLSTAEDSKPAIATGKHWENLEDDPQFKAVLEPETAKEEVAKLAPEDLIRDDRQVSELIVPTPEQQQARTTGLPPEQVVRAAEDNSLPEITALESTVETPLLDRLDADLRRLRKQAEIVASQSLNAPIFLPQPIAIETYAFNFNDDYGAVSSQELEQLAANLEDEFNFEDELAIDNAIDVNAIANSVNPQLFEQDLRELGLEIFEKTLFEGEAMASAFLFDGSSLDASSLGAIEMDFNALLANWKSALPNDSLTQDFTALIPAHLLSESSLNFEGEMPDLSGQGEDIFAIESAFEELPELNFGNHPFEFGFQHDFLRASLPLPSKKSM
ncbi:MAG: hypothetical protein AB4290_26620 [Spirulina sp.]